MTTETHAGRIRKEFNSTGDVWPSDIEWLIEQADRAQEFELKIQKYRKRFERLYKGNCRMREALEKIAASGLDCFENECTYIARRALAGETNGQHQA